MKKGQISIEFIFMITIIMVFSLSLISVISYYHKSEIKDKSDDSVNNILLYLQNEVITASKMRSGYSKDFELPLKIDNKNYDIETYTNEIILEFMGNEHIIIIPDVEGNISIPSNTIKKVGEVIKIN